MFYLIFRQIVLVLLVFNLAVPASLAQGIDSLNLPAPGVAVNLSEEFVPVLLKGMVISPKEPLRFDFIIDSGNAQLSADEIKQESQRLIKYFLTGLTLPKDDVWVNLSPYEADKMISESLGQTELGRDMLAQDYILKQLTASIIDPQKDLGKEFWSKIRQKVAVKYGSQEVPVNTFNKVWIVPSKATVYENNNTAYVTESHLKVMLDVDYLSESKNVRAGSPSPHKGEATSPVQGANQIGSEIVREIIIPAIEKEVNEGSNFAQVRQIYHSLILAKWYKEAVKKSLLSQVYIDQKKVSGVEVEDTAVKDQIYKRYVQAFKKGVFNFIKEDVSTDAQGKSTTVARKYFSGGLSQFLEIPGFGVIKKGDAAQLAGTGQLFRERVNLNPQDSAMIVNRQNLYVAALFGATACLGGCSTVDSGFRNDVGALVLARDTKGIDPSKATDLYYQIKDELKDYDLDFTDISILERMSVQPGMDVNKVTGAYKAIKRKLDIKSLSFEHSDIPSLIYTWVKTGKDIDAIIDIYINLRGRMDLKYKRIVINPKASMNSKTFHSPGHSVQTDYDVSDIPILVYVATVMGEDKTLSAYDLVRNELDVKKNVDWFVYVATLVNGDVSKMIDIFKDVKANLDRYGYGYDESDVLILVYAAIQSQQNGRSMAIFYSEILDKLKERNYDVENKDIPILVFAAIQDGQSVEKVLIAYSQIRQMLDKRYVTVHTGTRFDGSSKTHHYTRNTRIDYNVSDIPFLILQAAQPGNSIEQVLSDYQYLKREIKDTSNDARGPIFMIPNVPASSNTKQSTIIVSNDKPADVGGIDLNNIAIKHVGRNIEIQFTPENLKWITNQTIDGFNLEILDVDRLPSVLPLLGLEAQRVEKK